ncbi:MAG: glycoside hydrolase family 97 protein [Alphaproteobacteria bacterium]|nr:glycoside hydrolase family 97 protein [Alphaproteobacteria bacterium]MBV9370128.1 glycoside hydrolase family 97 protein [Alphaproteobacteria bacterium]MBV9901468.1 glycoside hydrolase family 97 protein [Alphaproteobacteria bacterium]
MTRLLLLLAIFVASPALAADPVTVASPGGTLTVAVGVNGEGRPEYSVSRLGRPVILPSRLGFLLTDAPKLERNFAVAASARRSVDETWEQPWGERRFVRNRFNELRVTLEEKSELRRRLDLVFRVYDDGVGFRYEFPLRGTSAGVRIAEELTEFALAEPATAWWIPAFQWNREEYLYNRTPLSEVGIAQTPMTVRTESGLHIAFHEAALVDYSGMNLQNEGHGRFRAVLTPSSDGPKVSRTAPFATPWRTMQIADTAGGLVTNNLILNLNEPSRLPDIRRWFTPFKYVGVWWAMHLDKETWGPGPRHGATTANVKRYIDFAAANGFRGVLVEGWNEGWNDDWFANGRDFSFTKPYPDFDIEALARYARAKGVHLIGHHETAGNIANYEAQLGPALDLYKRLGIDAVKTGYVADMGGIQALGADGRIHFEWHEGQVMARHHLKVVQEAAARHIAVNPHEPIKDTGLRRTWPNWVAREGARGMEFNAWGQPPNPPEHETNLVFTRMLAGPMDFTPGVLSLEGRGQPIQSTQAKQLALYVVIYSPIVMAADLIENYAANPRPFQFIKDVPTDWAETLVLNGEIGDYVTIARKDRNSENWYLGAVTDENGRSLAVPLAFLTAGKTYRAQIYRDGPTADYRGHGKDIVIEERLVTAADVLTLTLAPGGGEAIRFVAGGR